MERKHLLRLVNQMPLTKQLILGIQLLFDRLFNNLLHLKHFSLIIYYSVNPYSAGIDLSRQNLMSVDVRF